MSYINYKIESSLRSPLKIASFLIASVALTACGGESTNGSTDEEVTSLGRLVIHDQDGASVKVFDLEIEQVIETYLLSGEAPRLAASPDNRYAVIIQRANGEVSFLDGGLYSEDHGDHQHAYENDPEMLGLSLSGTKPTHYSVHDDYATVFFDGQDGLTSTATIVSDASIGSGEVVSELTLANNMHGVAKLIDDQFFVTYRDPLITDTTLPAAVDRYSFEDGTLTFQYRYSEECSKLRGSAATDVFIVFGCADGVLAIDLSQTTYPATKLSNPESIATDGRIGTLYAHHDVEEFIGVAGNQFYAIDVSAAENHYQEISLPEGVSRVTAGFNVDGGSFYILGNDGNLYLSEKVDSSWSITSTTKVTDAIGDDEEVKPVVVASQAEDVLFVINTGGQSIYEVDTHTGETLKTINLDFTASALVWVGQSDDHEHDH